MVLRVRGGRHGVDQGVEVAGAADPVEVPALAELVGHGDRVGGITLGHDGQDRVVDRLVGGAVVVVGLEDVGDVRDGVPGQQHAAEHGLLRAQVLGLAAGRHPLERGLRLRDIRAGLLARAAARGRHGGQLLRWIVLRVRLGRGVAPVVRLGRLGGGYAHGELSFEWVGSSRRPGLSRGPRPPSAFSGQMFGEARLASRSLTDLGAGALSGGAAAGGTAGPTAGAGT